MSTSTWVTLVAAIVGGGAVGTVLTTFWRIKHERAEAWRSRLLDAADDFATGALEALMKLERMQDWLGFSHGGDDHGLSKPQADALREADALVALARARLARVHLLFGSKSPSGTSAGALVDHLRSLSKAFWGDPEGGGIEWNDAEAALNAARASLDSFQEAARMAAWDAAIS
jgi:hypothetical protein